MSTVEILRLAPLVSSDEARLARALTGIERLRGELRLHYAFNEIEHMLRCCEEIEHMLRKLKNCAPLVRSPPSQRTARSSCAANTDLLRLCA